MDAILADKIKPGDVVVIRYEGPKGGPGMREMLALLVGVDRQGIGRIRGTHHRRTLLRRHVGHGCERITPEAFEGGPIAIVKEGDSITIDAKKRLVQLDVSKAELARRKAKWKQPKPRYTGGVLGKYAKLVGDASHGAVTD